MAQILERLDQSFPWAHSPLQTDLRRLMSALEPRFQKLEGFIPDWETAVDQITSVGINRVNETLGPLLEQLEQAANLGFLVAYATNQDNTMVQDEPFGIIINSEGKELFFPTPFLLIQDTEDADNWGIAELQSYDNVTGELTVTMLYVNVVGQPSENWAVADSAGVFPAMLEIQTDVNAKHAEVVQAQEDFADDLATLQTLIESLQSGAVVSVAGKSGVVTLVVADVSGLQTALDNLAAVDATKATTTYVNTAVAAKQDASAKLTSLSNLTWGADLMPYFTSTSAIATATISSFIRTLLDDADATAARATLGITGASAATDAQIRSATGTGFVQASSLESAAALVTLTDATTIAVDWDAFINATVTLTANRTLGNPTNVQIGTTRTVRVQGSSGTPRVLSFASNYNTMNISTTLDTYRQNLTTGNIILLTLYADTSTRIIVTALLVAST
jgi:hypothetical protein